MMKSNLLRNSVVAFNIFKVVYIFGYVFFISMCITWFIDCKLFGNIDITSGYKAGFGITNINFSPENLPPKSIIFSKITILMMIWLIVRNTVLFVLGFFILKQIKAILNNIKGIETFYSKNIKSFQTIGRLFFIISAVSFFNFYISGAGSMIDFTVPFLPILFGFGSFILAEIFNEGLSLTEDKNSIV